MFAAALTRRAYLPCGSALYSVQLGCAREGTRSLHLEGSVSRLSNCLNREYVSRDVWEIFSLFLSCVITAQLLRNSTYVIALHTDISRGQRVSARISRRGSIRRFHGSRDSSTRAGMISSEEFFEFFAWFANTVGIYSNTSIHSGNILTRRNFDSCVIALAGDYDRYAEIVEMG